MISCGRSRQGIRNNSEQVPQKLSFSGGTRTGQAYSGPESHTANLYVVEMRLVAAGRDGEICGCGTSRNLDMEHMPARVIAQL